MSAAIEIPESLAALLPKVRRKPLPLSRKGKTAALLVSVHEYQKYQKLRQAVAEMEEDENRYWSQQADKARAEYMKNPPKESIAVRDKKFRKILDEIIAS